MSRNHVSSNFQNGFSAVVLAISVALAGLALFLYYPKFPQVLSNSSSRAIPGLIQAEDYDVGAAGDAFYDTDPNKNRGGSYRFDGVDIERIRSIPTGYSIGYAYEGEWLRYTLQVEEDGVYDIKFRVARGWNRDAALNVEIDSQIVGTIVVSGTGGWHKFVDTYEINDISLKEGLRTVYIRFKDTGINLDWFEFTKTAVTSPTFNSIPGLIEAEDYNNYYDTTPQNSGGTYRNDPVDIEYTRDSSGRYNVSYIYPSEWLEYNIDAQKSEEYLLNIRTARRHFGAGKLDVFLDDAFVSTVSIDSTGGWQSWQNTTGPIINISKGEHVLKLVFIEGSFNINWLDFTKVDDVDPEFAVCSGASKATNHSVRSPDELISTFPNADAAHIRDCYNYIINRSQETGNDPAFMMAIWIEESWASNYARFPTVLDFGCGTSSLQRNFDKGFECMLRTQQVYLDRNDWRNQCSAIRSPEDVLDVKEYFQIYACGPGSPNTGINCYDDPPVFDFGCTATNQGGGTWPDRISRYYSLVRSDGVSIDQEIHLPSANWSR